MFITVEKDRIMLISFSSHYTVLWSSLLWLKGSLGIFVESLNPLQGTVQPKWNVCYHLAYSSSTCFKPIWDSFLSRTQMTSLYFEECLKPATIDFHMFFSQLLVSYSILQCLTFFLFDRKFKSAFKWKYFMQQLQCFTTISPFSLFLMCALS